MLLPYVSVFFAPMFSMVAKYAETIIQPCVVIFRWTLLFHCNLSMLCVKLWIMTRACVTACLEIAQYCPSLSDIKERHTVALTHTKAMGYTFTSSFIHLPPKKKKKKKDKRIESSLKWKLEGPRESQSETHINIHTHMEESAVSRMDLSWRGSTLPLCPLFEVRHRPYVQAPERGMSTHTPHRLAEGSGLSGAHNAVKRMELPNWAAFSSCTFLTHAGVILLRDRLLRPIKFTRLDWMFAMLWANKLQFERVVLCDFYHLYDNPVVSIKLF